MLYIPKEDSPYGCLVKDNYPKNMYSEYNAKLHSVVWFHFWSSEMWEVTPLLSLLPDPLWLVVVVLVRVSSMGQLDLFKNYYEKIGILETILLCANYLHC